MRAGTSSFYRATLLTCWKEVLSGPMLDLQCVHRELMLLDQRVPDRTFFEMMWSVVARGLVQYVSEVRGGRGGRERSVCMGGDRGSVCVGEGVGNVCLGGGERVCRGRGGVCV